MKKSNKNILLVLALVGICILLISVSKNETLEKVQSGKYQLSCYIDDEYKTIDKSKVTGFNDEAGYWEFTNGWAKNCEVTKGN